MNVYAGLFLNALDHKSVEAMLIGPLFWWWWDLLPSFLQGLFLMHKCLICI